MLASFIIPSYNSAHTVRRCLDSIYSLPMEEIDFEVILVDDCSTDNSVELVKEYVRDHSNLVLLRQSENHRQGAARNRGVAVAKGKYIVFVDSDDETAKGVISAVQMAEDRNLDMIAMQFIKVDENGTIDKALKLPYNQNMMFAGVEMQTDIPFWNTGPCAYVYRRTFLDKVNYPFAEDVLFEDSDFVNVHLFHAKRMLYCDECGYVIHYNSASTTHTFSYKHLCDYALLGTRMLRFYESLKDKTSKYAEGIREGGSYNIMKAFYRLPKLMNCSEIRAFYDRFDAHYNRKLLLGYREPAYCWTRWTRFCIKHRGLVVALMGIVIPFIKIRAK